eukprot:scaffold186_cov32-Attheya_sp.AAC.3
MKSGRHTTQFTSPASCTHTSVHIIVIRQIGKEVTQNALPKTLLQARIYQSNFPRKIVFGPKFFGRIKAKDLEGEQGAAKIQALLKHIRNDNTIGHASQILTRWAQLQAGTSKPILEDHQDIPYIENQWMVTLRNYMIQIKATIQEEKPWTIPSARVHDQHIMDAFLQSPSIPKKDYAALNYCRLYLRVTTLSDITTSDGKQIMHAILTGYRDLHLHVDPTEWPHQAKPDKPTWNKWENHLLAVHCTNGSHLRQPLGKWTEAPVEKWKYRYSHPNKAMYAKDEDEWLKYDLRKSKCNRRFLIATHHFGDTTQLPEGTIPITDVEETFSGKKFTIPSTLQETNPTETPIIATFEQYISTLPKWIQQLIQSTQEEFHENQTALHEFFSLLHHSPL